MELHRNQKMVSDRSYLCSSSVAIVVLSGPQPSAAVHDTCHVPASVPMLVNLCYLTQCITDQDHTNEQDLEEAVNCVADCKLINTTCSIHH